MNSNSSSSEPPRPSGNGYAAYLPSWNVLVGATLLIIVALLGLLAYQRVQAVQAEYRGAVDQVGEIHAVANQDDIYALSAEDMTWLKGEFATLDGRIDEIERLTELPLGLEGPLSSLPWIAPRYDAGMQTLEVGRLLAQAGEAIADVGEEAIAALDETGVRFDPENDGETWLDVISEREPELYGALDQIDDSMAQRADIEELYLPERIVARLQQIDGVIDQFSEQLELADELPLAYEALGAEEPARYLILFQNPTELRPTGGFVGTVAQLELHRGQISYYEFYDVYELTLAYQDQSDLEIEPPWGIAEYVREDDLQIQDANWWSHFPSSAELLLEMVSAAGWESMDGVVAVQPETIQDLISVSGAISVDVDGDERQITSENLLEESERQRRIQREGEEAETEHKEVIELISEVLIDQLAEGDRNDLIDVVFLLFDRFDQRDMQVFHENGEVQTFLEERNWAGLSEPEEGTPTLSATFANITGLKTSLVMQPDIHISLSETDSAGTIEAMLTLGLNHEGAEEGDPFYEGFQRWWVDVALPDEAMVLGTMPDVSEDPDGSSGGAYVVDLDVGEREEIVIRWTMPETERLVIRRQPGLVPMQGVVEKDRCDDILEFTGDTDQVLVLDGECPKLESFIDDDE